MRRFRPTTSRSRRPAAPRRPQRPLEPEFAFDVRRQWLLRCPADCARLLGYTCAELLAMGANLLPHLLQPGSLAQVQAARLGPLLANGRTYRWVCGLRHRDGSPRWLRLHLRLGTGHEVVGSMEDVTRHRAAVTALRNETRKMRHLLHVMPTPIYVQELSTSRCLYCGPQSIELSGHSDQQILGLGSNVLGTFLEPPHEAAYRAYLTEAADLADGETRALEYAIRHRDGHLRWMRATHTPYERDDAGRVLTVMGVVEEITDRRAGEEARHEAVHHLAAQHHLFRQVIDTLPHPIYLKDGDGRYVLANNALAAIYETTPDELVVCTTPPPPSADTDRYVVQDRQVLATGHDLTVEESFTMPDGGVLWFVVTKRLFVQADGSRLVLGVDTDITELKRTQQALEAAKAEAERNVQAKQDFLANMSHEIRTPLHGIIGLTDVLTKTQLDVSQREHLRLLAGSADHLLHVLDDVLTTARLGVGKLQPEAVPFAPRELLQSCAALMRPKAGEKKLRLHVLAPLALPQVVGDAHRLRQVLLNLVSNALKFTETGEVVLRCRVVPSPLDAEPDAVWLAFSVADTGIGIAPAMLERVFEPFEQAASSTSREYGGSGLGPEHFAQLGRDDGRHAVGGQPCWHGQHVQLYVAFHASFARVIPCWPGS